MGSKKQEDIRSLCDLHQPLTDEDRALMDRVYGSVPEPKAVKRPPNDELYAKQKASRDYWRRS